MAVSLLKVRPVSLAKAPMVPSLKTDDRVEIDYIMDLLDGGHIVNTPQERIRRAMNAA